MYRPPAFREDRRDVLHEAIRAHPLATLITSGPSGLIANVLPFHLRSDPDGDVLCAHLAKANEQIADLRVQAAALVMFQGPQAYISPSWYPTKQEHGKAVPTWNYVVVQVRGIPRVIDDRAWVRDQLEELTAAHESGRADPWSIQDAPTDYIDGQLKGIVGLEIPIDRIEGKWKVSQNQPMSNSLGVARELEDDGYHELANEVIVRARGS